MVLKEGLIFFLGIVVWRNLRPMRLKTETGQIKIRKAQWELLQIHVDISVHMYK